MGRYRRTGDFGLVWLVLFLFFWVLIIVLAKT